MSLFAPTEVFNDGAFYPDSGYDPNSRSQYFHSQYNGILDFSDGLPRDANGRVDGLQMIHYGTHDWQTSARNIQILRKYNPSVFYTSSTNSADGHNPVEYSNPYMNPVTFLPDEFLTSDGSVKIPERTFNVSKPSLNVNYGKFRPAFSADGPTRNVFNRNYKKVEDNNEQCKPSLLDQFSASDYDLLQGNGKSKTEMSSNGPDLDYNAYINNGVFTEENDSISEHSEQDKYFDLYVELGPDQAHSNSELTSCGPVGEFCVEINNEIFTDENRSITEEPVDGNGPRKVGVSVGGCPKKPLPESNFVKICLGPEENVFEQKRSLWVNGAESPKKTEPYVSKPNYYERLVMEQRKIEDLVATGVLTDIDITRKLIRMVIERCDQKFEVTEGAREKEVHGTKGADENVELTGGNNLGGTGDGHRKVVGDPSGGVQVGADARGVVADVNENKPETNNKDSAGRDTGNDQLDITAFGTTVFNKHNINHLIMTPEDLNQKLQSFKSSDENSDTINFFSQLRDKKNENIIDVNLSEKLKVDYFDYLFEEFKHRTDVDENRFVYYSAKVYFPYVPGYSLVGRMLGPGGTSLRRLEFVTGTTIIIRGQGSTITPLKERKLRRRIPHLKEDLHALIICRHNSASECFIRLEAAVATVSKLLTPRHDEFKRHQRKELALMNRTSRP